MPETLDAQTASGAGAKVTLGGRELTLHPLTVGDLGELQAWVHTQLPTRSRWRRNWRRGSRPRWRRSWSQRL